jgi:hypothetical protein
MPLAELPGSYGATRLVARRIGAHIMSRTRKAAVGRIDLAPFSGGIGTPSFGVDHCVIRLSGGLLIVERTGVSATTKSLPVNGATLAEMADLTGADLAQVLDVGHDTPALGDVDEALEFDPAASTQIGTWFAFGLQVIDRVVAAQPVTAAPTRARIWPEHFDLGIDLAAAGGMRLNLGASPGDEYHEAPYLYVSPWDSARPGDQAYWNAPFGAVLGYDELASAPSAIAAGIEFMADGIRRLD